MSIVATEIESLHGTTGQQRMIFYRCQDSEGQWHKYGPVLTIDDSFDADAFKSVAAEKVAARLADAETDQLLEG